MRVKHYISALLALAIIGAVGLAAAVGVILKRERQAVETSGRASSDFRSVRLLAANSDELLAVMDLLTTESTGLLLVVDRFVTRCRGNLVELGRARTLEDPGLLKKIQETFDHMVEQGKRAAITGSSVDAHEAELEKFDALAAVYLDLLSQLQRRAEGIATQEVRRLALHHRWNLLTIALIGAGYLLTIGVAQRWVTRSVVQPVQHFAEAAQDAMANDRGFSLAECGPAEIRSLTRTVRSFVHSLEAKVEERTVALRANEARIQSVFDSALDAIITMDQGARISGWNPQAQAVFGWTREEAIGRNLADLLIPAQHRAAHQRGLERFLQTGEGRILNQRVEMVGLHRLGHEFPVELAVTAVRSPGRVDFSAFARDISERQRSEAIRKQAETALEQARQQAEAANRAKSEFLANMSHEIRTPMNGILGMTELALETGLSDEQRDYMNTVQECANSLLGLLNDILDLSKIEAGKMELESADFDLVDTVEGVADVLAHRAAEKGLELICQIDPSVPHSVRGDSVRLRQVLVNLAGNAVKFTEHGEVVIAVGVEKESTESVALRFSVSDTGVGIPADRQAAVFESFTQADGAVTRKYGGTGLGLTISKQFVGLMGGEISLQSEPGVGSVFSFGISLPRGASETGLEDAERQLSQSAVAFRLRGKRVLVVDDNATNRRVLHLTLASWRCEPILAGGGREALDYLRTAGADARGVDLVLLDVQMPELDGMAVAASVWQDAAYGNPPIIFVSSLASRKDLGPAHLSRCAACLTKPLRQSVLKQTLLRVLGMESPTESTPNEQASFSGSTGAERCRLPCRVLLVEDNPVNRRVAVGVLSKLGHHVSQAENGRAALQVLERQSFDLVLMDVQMPEMDGFECTRRMRADERFKTLPIIAMTAHAMKGDRERCLSAGMDDYLAKPIQAAELRKVVEKWMERAAATQPSSDATAGDPSPDGLDTRTVDIGQALEQLGGDRELLYEVLATFADYLPTLVEQFRSACVQADAVQLRSAAHSLKGSASNICAGPARMLAEKLEGLALRGELDEARMLMGELELHLDRVRDEIAGILKA